MIREPFLIIGFAGAVASFVACAAVGEPHSFNEGGNAPGASGSGAGPSGFGGDFNPATGSGGGATTCVDDSTKDDDGDGFLGPEDCNDCDANVNPAAVEVVDESGGAPVDEDCDGQVDNVAGPCDEGLLLDDADPLHAAQAIELCREASGAQDWGLKSARYVRASGALVEAPTPQHGIFEAFGTHVTPRGGQRMLALSTGRARIPGQPDACGALSCDGLGPGAAPQGFPQDVPNCPGDAMIHDDIALEVSLKAPSNATGVQFDFRFYSFEYPEWVCSAYNDQFIALMTPPPMGSINGNISFDSMHNPVSVNVAFFDVCEGCPQGAQDLEGTGFGTWDDAGGTGWLSTSAPVGGGEDFTIRFAIWDTGDPAWDSTAIIDNFQWIANGGTVVVGTEEVPR
jgi:hypothetical protein